jgi:hypothetical protein
VELLGPAHRTLLARMALLSNGTVTKLGGRGGGESSRIGPPGDSRPLVDEWAARFAGAQTADALARLFDEAQAALDHHLRRAFAPDTTETWEELASRIVRDGWGITAAECARAMRCTPSMVQRARLAEMRHPDTGYALPAKMDAVAWARALDDAGLSERQIVAVTGMSKGGVYRMKNAGKARRPGHSRRAYA